MSARLAGGRTLQAPLLEGSFYQLLVALVSVKLVDELRGHGMRLDEHASGRRSSGSSGGAHGDAPHTTTLGAAQPRADL